jgi:hypothetical protein
MLRLTKGYFAVVDKADYERVSFHKWFTKLNGRGKAYAKRKIKGRDVPLQRFIMDVDERVIVDHINRDTLDYRRNNLRVCSPVQNGWNRPVARIPKTSPYKGVHKSVYRGGAKWRAQICAYGKRFHLGQFMTEEEAAQAYNLKAIELFGEFAVLNDIPCHKEPT